MRSSTHRLFGLITACLIGWSTANYLSVNLSNTDDIFLAVRFIFFFVIIQNMAFFLIAYTYPDAKIHISKSRLKSYVVYSLLLSVAVFADFIFKGYVPSGQTISLLPNFGIVFFVLHAAVSILGGLRRLIIRARKVTGIERRQIGVLLLASTVLFGVVPLTNFALPILFNINIFASLSPLYALAFAGLIAYGIVAHRLFDIRAVVARSIAYILTLITFVALYSGAVLILSLLVFRSSENVGSNQHLTYVTLALIFSPTVYWLKRFFDHITNKIFYRDAYDPQAFIDRFNQVLVSNIDLDRLLKNCAYLIEDNIKSSFCVFVINKRKNSERRVIGVREAYEISKTDFFDKITSELHSKIIVADYLKKDNKPLGKLLLKKDIGVLVRLGSVTTGEADGIGYIVLGVKKNGSSYNNQDLRMFDIISDELIIAIQNALRFHEIEEFSHTLQQKVEDATKELRRTNEKLKALDETKDEFISMASHQLRTPLTSVKGYISMVMDGDAGPITESQKKLLDQAFISSQRMVYLIADLLNVSRLRTGKFVIEPKPTNLANLVEGEIAQLKETAVGRKLQLLFDKPKDFPILMLDETKIRQVVMNFIDNAMYYTLSNGKIEVTLRETEQSIEFRVTDTGIGVPKSEQPHLFSKFYRAGNAKKARPDGTGLGLFMAKKVIIAQGGSIIFSSSEGKGSTFGFTFSKARLAVPEHLK